MTDKTYLSRAVEGMTSIPIRTIQSYVKDFRDCFSETARQPSKGRRFTDADVKTILTIKRARAQRLPDDDIRKIISGELAWPLGQEYHEDDIKQMVINASMKLEQAITLIQSFEGEIENINKAHGKMWNDIHTLKEEVKALISRADHFREWQVYMMKNYDEFNPFTDKSKDPEETTEQGAKPAKKKGFSAWLRGE